MFAADLEDGEALGGNKGRLTQGLERPLNRYNHRQTFKASLGLQ